MEKFILVSLDANKKVLKESVDLHGLVSKGFEFKSDITSVCESMDVISANGYRVIVESQTPFIHSSNTLTEAGLADLYKKFKEKFGGTKDEFEEWYQEKMAEKQAAGTDNGAGIPPSMKNRPIGGYTSGSPVPIKGVGGGTSPRPMSMRTRTEPAPRDSEEDIKAKQDKVSKSRRMINPTKAYIRKMFSNDKESYVKLLNELIADFKQNWEEPLSEIAKF